MAKTLNAFILAAGLGERLRPITNNIPKPLLPILGKPVLQSVIEKVLTLPVNKIGINLHHKKELIEKWIKQYSFKETIMSKKNQKGIYPSPTPLPQGEGARGRVNIFSSKNIKLFPEKQILGTGGALKNADKLLGKSTFLVHNSDIVSGIDLGALIKSHNSSKNLVTLAVHDYPKFNNLVIDENGFLKEIVKIIPPYPPLSKGGSGGFKRLAFTGIAVYEPEFLKFLPAGASSVVDTWLKAVDAGYNIGTFNASGSYWSDIGTPGAYASAIFDALRSDGEIVYIHPSIKNCKDVELQGHVVLEKGCTLDKGVSLKNCILLPKSHIKKNLHYKNCILGPGLKININEAEIFRLSKNDGRQLIGTGGSERTYYRVKRNNKRAVLMQCKNDDPDFERHIEYTKFFLKHSIPIPELIEVSAQERSAIFQDLGDLSLYSWLKCRRKSSQIENIYKNVIDILILIHTAATRHASECPVLQKRVFDYEHFRWETNYFIERFVEGIENIRAGDPFALKEEFHSLAMKADSFPKTVIHRDFQSQNIMVTKGDVPRLIDYQGARMGPPAYDIASVLWDPYYRLRDIVRDRLLDYYASEMTNKSSNKFQEKDFRQTLLSCRLQRHMQALGAYGFLSAVKGKQYFLKHVPEGLRLLKEDMLFAKKEYPVLYGLVMKL